MGLREVIISILEKGEKSPYLNCFCSICAAMSLSCFKKSRFKNEVLTAMPHSLEDIAADLIGDLFRCEDGKYICINKFFSTLDIGNLNEDIIESKLFSLIYSRTNQRITKIRIENGVIFFKIEKAVNQEIKRHPEIFRTKNIGDKIFVFTCKEKDVCFDKPECEERILLDVLFGQKYKTAEIPEILKYIFEFLNNQDDFCKAVEKIKLITLVTNFYGKK